MEKLELAAVGGEAMVGVKRGSWSPETGAKQLSFHLSV